MGKETAELKTEKADKQADWIAATDTNQYRK
jgi:hypothetical protein